MYQKTIFRLLAAAMLLQLAACANTPQGANVETAYYSVPVPPYTRSIFNTTNF